MSGVVKHYIRSKDGGHTTVLCGQFIKKAGSDIIAYAPSMVTCHKCAAILNARHNHGRPMQSQPFSENEDDYGRQTYDTTGLIDRLFRHKVVVEQDGHINTYPLYQLKYEDNDPVVGKMRQPS